MDYLKKIIELFGDHDRQRRLLCKKINCSEYKDDRFFHENNFEVSYSPLTDGIISVGALLSWNANINNDFDRDFGFFVEIKNPIFKQGKYVFWDGHRVKCYNHFEELFLELFSILNGKQDEKCFDRSVVNRLINDFLTHNDVKDEMRGETKSMKIGILKKFYNYFQKVFMRGFCDV